MRMFIPQVRRRRGDPFFLIRFLIVALTLIENADLNFIFNIASKEEEELRLEFNWMPKSMRQLSDPNHIPADTQLIMFGLPHHQERILPVEGSSNRIIPTGCIYTLHGLGCMIEGGYWSMREVQ